MRKKTKKAPVKKTIKAAPEINNSPHVIADGTPRDLRSPIEQGTIRESFGCLTYVISNPTYNEQIVTFLDLNEAVKRSGPCEVRLIESDEITTIEVLKKYKILISAIKYCVTESPFKSHEQFFNDLNVIEKGGRGIGYIESNPIKPLNYKRVGQHLENQVDISLSVYDLEYSAGVCFSTKVLPKTKISIILYVVKDITPINMFALAK
jgi:hypothetical protein